MQTLRLPKYLLLSSFALLTATTGFAFNDATVKADTTANSSTTAVTTTNPATANTVTLTNTSQNSTASATNTNNSVADDADIVSDSSASSVATNESTSSAANVPTEAITYDSGNVAQSDASWTLKGLGNYTFAQLDYYNANQTAQPAGELTIKVSGQPHSYFPNAQYARVTVSRGAETLFD